MSIIKQPKIILTGTYSSFNKGDAAMQISTAEQIKSVWPNAEVIISSPFPEIDKNLYQNYKIIKSTRRNLPFSTLQILRAKIYVFFKKLGLNFLFLVNNEELRHFREADMVVDLSGDTLTEDYGPHVTYSHFLPIWLGVSLKKPVFVCAQSIGPFKLTSRFSRHMLNKTAHVTAREEITYQYLSGLGVDPKITEQTADMAFLLKPVNKQEVKRIYSKEKIKPINKPILGVTVSNLVAKRFDAKNPEQDLIQTIAGVLDKFIKEHDATVFLLGHVTGPSDEKNDRLVAGKIKANMKQKGSAFVFKGDYSPGEIKGIIAECDIFLGSRMHSNIAALSSGIPTLAIGYSHKTQGIMSLFGMDRFVLDIDTIDGTYILKALNDIFDKRSSVSKKLNEKILKVKSRSTRNIEIIKNAVSKEL